MSKHPIVLIHGLWMNALCWEHWVARYQQRGHEVIARSWPGLETIEAVRKDSSAIEDLGIDEIVDHYATIIGTLAEKPIIIGHSFGALITQILLGHGWGFSGVSIDFAPANRYSSVTLTPEQFRAAFTNALGEEGARAAYERYAMPGPVRPLVQAAFASLEARAATRSGLHDEMRAPLLVIAAGAEHVSPPMISRTVARLQHKAKSITAYVEFPGRSHFILGEPGWEQVADFALEWALEPTPLQGASS